MCDNTSYGNSLMCLMGLGTGVAAPSRDIMIRGATVAKLGKKSFGRVYGFTYCGSFGESSAGGFVSIFTMTGKTQKKTSLLGFSTRLENIQSLTSQTQY